MRDSKAAFKWIVKILRKNKIPFQISGGLAARAYGAKRQLADIDIDLPDNYVREPYPLLQKFVVRKPSRYYDKNWNVLYMALVYKGQRIELCGAESRQIFDSRGKKWIGKTTNFDNYCMRTLFGIRVPVIPKKQLVDFKRKLGREVDKIDVRQMA